MNARLARWSLRAATALATLALLCAAAAAQEWSPTRPIRIIAPFAPGGTADILARMLAQDLTGSLGQTVVVENRSGANTVIATDTLVRAPADGYTIGIISTPFFVTAALVKDLPYRPSDVQPLALLGRISLVLVTNPTLGAQAPQDLVGLAREKPLAFASGGNGTASHLAGALFQLRTKGRYTHVPYRGGGPALTELMGGQTQFMFNAVGSTVPFIKSGRLHALAVTGAKRSSALPDVPTMGEAGFNDFEFYEFFGLVLPPNTPPEIGRRLGREVAKFVRSAEMQRKADDLGLELVDETPAQFQQYIDSGMKRVRDIVKDANIQLQ